jgi:hypothetical protein
MGHRPALRHRGSFVGRIVLDKLSGRRDGMSTSVWVVGVCIQQCAAAGCATDVCCYGVIVRRCAIVVDFPGE